jgi:NADPH:quinone reductase-like Zn-dependent oxidoreductase
MLRINPPTALLLLGDVVSLRRGEWIIQNAANSAVGRLIIRLAQRQGLKTVNVIRRESLFAELEALGADVCVVDGPGLAERVAELTGRAAIRLAADAVSGLATTRISECLMEGDTVCVYGSMTGDDPVISRSAAIYRGINLTGFMLGRFLAKRSLHQVREIYADLADQVVKGLLAAPVAEVYPIEAIKEAVRHAQMSARGGKVLVAPNGTV